MCLPTTLPAPHHDHTMTTPSAIKPPKPLQPGAPAPLAVQCVARSLAPVRARAGLRVLPDADFTSATAPDVLIVPGGVVDASAACTDTRAWMAQAPRVAEISTSLFTRASFLAATAV